MSLTSETTMNKLDFEIPMMIFGMLVARLGFSKAGDEIGGGESITLGFNGEELYLYIERHNNKGTLNINIKGK